MLIGNVGKDPEVRYLDGNNNPNSGSTKVATFTLATTERYRDRNGELRENTEWHNIVAWRNSADVAEKYIRKGTQLYIEGKLRTRSWTDQTGNKRYTTEITVDNLQLLGRKSDNPWCAGWRAGSGWLQCRTRTAGWLSAGSRVRSAGPSTGSGTGEWCNSGGSRECGSGAGIRTASVPTGWLPTCAATDSATSATAGIPAAADPAASAAGSGESDRGRGGRYAAG